MSRRRRRSGFHEPSLVPLADMLCNTVGITVFILIFTVLAAGSAVLKKRLPFEHTVAASDEMVVLCYHNRVLPTTVHDLLKKIIEEAQADQQSSSSSDSPKSYTEEDGFVSLVLSLNSSGGGHLELRPKEDVGDTCTDVGDSDSAFCKMLATKKPDGSFIHFFVYTDSVTAFGLARDVARRLHYEVDWDGVELGKPFYVGTGGAAVAQ